MSVKKGRLPVCTIHFWMKEAGAEKVSKKAVVFMESMMKEYVGEMTRKALRCMEHRNGKLLMKKDVMELKQLIEGI